MRLIRKFQDSGKVEQDTVIKPWREVEPILPIGKVYEDFRPVGTFSTPSNYVELVPLVREKDSSKNKSNVGSNKHRDVSYGMNYIRDYYYSPGFNYRLQKAKYLSPSDFEAVNFKVNPEQAPLQFLVDFSSDADLANAFYEGLYDDDAIISFGSDKMLWDPPKTWDMIAAHEATHAVDDLMSQYNVSGIDYAWSEAFPIFTKEHKFRKNPELLDNLSEEEYGNRMHDLQPGESYADLGAFRELLFRLGIYDSRGITPFTKKHLEEFKKSKVYARLLEYFDDDAIIWMMNNIAMNDNNQEPLLYIS